MNNALKGIIIFVSGAAVGGLTTWFSLKTYYRQKADSEIEEMQDMYLERVDELKEAYSKIVRDSIDDPELEECLRDEGDTKEGESTLRKEKSSIDELADTDKKKEPSVDYSVYFRKAEQKIKDLDMIKRGKEVMAAEEDENVLAESESPKDDEEYDDGESDYEDDIQQDDYEMYLVNEEHRKAVAENRPPYLINAEDFGHIPGYDTMDLYYYTVDKVLADEDREEVDVPDLFVGDLLECDWVNDDNIESICVRSDVTMTDVEVHKIEEKFYNE